jgi:hypothetical protein
MRDRNSRCRRMVTFLGLLLAFSAMACNGGPTEPSSRGISTGRWRGNITGWEVVVDIMRVDEGGQGGGLRLSGSAGALNPATGESHRLTIDGSAFLDDASIALVNQSHFSTGWFRGEVSRDRRTWSGQFESNTGIPGGASIFDPGKHSVTLTKQ